MAGAQLIDTKTRSKAVRAAVFHASNTSPKRTAAAARLAPTVIPPERSNVMFSKGRIYED